jgi:hypothetical protein
VERGWGIGNEEIWKESIGWGNKEIRGVEEVGDVGIGDGEEKREENKRVMKDGGSWERRNYCIDVGKKGVKM